MYHLILPNLVLTYDSIKKNQVIFRGLKIYYQKYLLEADWKSVHNVFKCKLYDNLNYENSELIRTPSTRMVIQIYK